MSSMRRRDRSCSLLMVITALSSYITSTDSLAFDISSKSSSTFTTCSTSRYVLQTSSSDTHLDRIPSSTSQLLTMKVSGSNKRSRSSKSSHLIELNNERLQTAGRPGTKKFMDPNKVFIGNLPYDATEVDVSTLFSKHWNIPLESVGDRVESIKIIRDWKTGQSKGYGFVQFYEPMVATSAMESVNKGKGWRIKGRRIRLDQGKKKESEDDKLVKKKKKKKLLQQQEREVVLDEEGRVIHSVLEEVEGGVATETVASIEQAREEEEDDGLGMSEDDMITFMEKGGLRGVMPLTEETAGFLGIEGLYDDDDDEGYDTVDESYFEEYYNANGYDDADFEEGGEEGDGEEDDEEIVYDGVFEEEYNPNEYEGLSDEEEAKRKTMNREARRAADKRRKKRKLPFKGFGTRD